MQKSVAAAASAAVTSTLLTLACCLPVGVIGAAGVFGLLAAFFNEWRVLFLAISGFLLIAGFVRAARAPKCSVRDRRVSFIILGAALIIVLTVVLAPQWVAGFMADYFPGGER